MGKDSRNANFSADRRDADHGGQRRADLLVRGYVDHTLCVCDADDSNQMTEERVRIYSRAEFLKLPAGTIYAKGKPWAFDGFNVKADTLTNDWVCLSPMWIEAHDDGEQWSRLDGMLERGESHPMASSYGRDGCFDPDEIFLVPERDDLERLRDMIDAALLAAR